MLVGYVVLQLSRLEVFIKGPNDLLAYTTRNLIECSIWCELIKTGEAAAEKFLDDALIDQRELIVDMDAEMMDALQDVSDIAPSIKDQLEHARVDPEELVTVLYNRILVVEGSRQKLQRRERRKHEAHLFKLCSKFIHPSAWFIGGFKKMLSDDIYRRMFLFDALEYAEECMAKCESYLTDL
jgi:hypothetical protein